MKEIVEELKSLKKMMDNQEYKKASQKIDEMQNKILSSQDAEQYMNDLVDKLR